MQQYVVQIDQPYQEFQFEEVNKPDLFLMDSEFILVGELSHDKTAKQFQYQFLNYPDNVRARVAALDFFSKHPDDAISNEVFSMALDDPFWLLRKQALDFYEDDTTGLFDKIAQKVVNIAQSDADPITRATALSLLETKDNKKYEAVFKASLYDSSYAVAGQALYGYLQNDHPDNEEVTASFMDETNFNITSSLADYFIVKEDQNKYEWFEDKLRGYEDEELWYFIRMFSMYLVNVRDAQINDGIAILEDIALNHHLYYNRFAAYQGLEMFEDREGLPAILEKIRATEEDPRVKQYFE